MKFFFRAFPRLPQEALKILLSDLEPNMEMLSYYYVPFPGNNDKFQSNFRWYMIFICSENKDLSYCTAARWERKYPWFASSAFTFCAILEAFVHSRLLARYKFH
mmetsp:Transcript_28631/g.44516  ORF Transcript_28631/g.44516 Transcript_28631/m.44516 type:complete len:104 (+) Transcript_28631:334-645(+)